ncbi:unnamed protein product [Rhizophagus irregularis]|nr:unnamed protein product [Rhizophagus irregularis]
MENILNPNFSYSPNMLFNSYYDSSYSGSDLLDGYQYESPDLLIFEFYGFPYDSSDLFLEDYDILNETQIGNVRRIDVSVNEDINRYDFPEDERINSRRYDISDDEDRNFNHQEWEYDDSKYEEEKNILELNQGMEFETCELAESYFNEYAKQQGFSFHKKRRILDPTDSTITRRRTYECSHARTHEIQKVILEENRRDRDSEMIGCLWHINFSFPKSGNGICINSIVGIHNHDMNPCITEIALKFQKLTDKMLEKVKFWTIEGRLGISTQYNLLVASFPNKVINKKDLSNAIQQFKKQAKLIKNDACQMLTELYLKKDDNPRWIIKPRFDHGERRLNSLFWMLPDQINAYERYHDIKHNSSCSNFGR